MTPQRAIQTATRNAADALGLLEQLGTVEKGKEADILAIAGNPLDDIGILRNTDAMRLVLKRGRILVDRRPQ
jgi:imidazolonepropionase-like amidohydrolase